MGKALHMNAASEAFITGNGPVKTHSAASFRGDVAWSYAEPVAIAERETQTLYVTKAGFSVTTAKHRNSVRRAAERAGWLVIEQTHGTIREMVREMGQGDDLGPHGRQYDRCAA